MSTLLMNSRKSKRATKTIVVCARCGKKQSVLAADAKFLLLCPRCGAGMREYSVRRRLEE